MDQLGKRSRKQNFPVFGDDKMPTLYIDKQEKKPEELIKHLDCDYEFADLKYGDYTNDEESFVVERKNWNDYYSSVKTGHLVEQCEKIRENFKGTAGIIFEGDFWAMVNTIKSKGMRHLMVFTRYRITMTFGMFFEECIDTYAVANTLQFLNKNGEKIGKGLNINRKKYVKTKDRRILPLCQVPGVGKKTAQNIIDVYGCIFDFLLAILEDEDKVMDSIDRFGPKTLAKVKKMFLSNNVYKKKVLTKEEYKKLQAYHVKKRATYNKLKRK